MASVRTGSGEATGSIGLLPWSRPEPISLAEATMSRIRSMHHQQLPTTASVASLIIVLVFIMFVLVPGALTLLSLSVGNIISRLI
jgi:hypothetical protein